MSRFKVANGMEAEVREVFRNRPRLVEGAAGFLGLEVYTDADDPAVFYLLTRWTDATSFHAWYSGPMHKLAHEGIPGGLRLDSSYTQVHVLERVAD
ncbi:MAG: antibiotic biosynthesis monooxygenase family protein [Bryobacteraceae bacterium]